MWWCGLAARTGPPNASAIAPEPATVASTMRFGVIEALSRSRRLGINRLEIVRNDDFLGLGGCQPRVERLDRSDRDDPANDLGCDVGEGGGGGGRDAGKVLERMRPTVMAGLAKLVDPVRK